MSHKISFEILNLFVRNVWTSVTNNTLNKRVISMSEDIGASPEATVSWLRILACWWTDLHQITLKCNIGIWITPKIPISDEFLAVFPKSLLNCLEAIYPK